MPTVVFERTGYLIEASDGGAVIDLCDAHPRAGVPFSCRDANCGTCRTEVVEGIELCEPPNASEAELLDIFGNKPRIRLACQLRLRAGVGRVRLRVTL